MTREIKFRAWDKQDKVMVYDAIDFELKRISCSPKESCDQFIGYDSFTYTRFEMMQYSGLKDKNGKEIYAGDIVRQKFRYDKKAEQGEVIMNSPVDWTWCGFRNIDVAIGYLYAEPEVIGNIYENPELLGEDDGL